MAKFTKFQGKVLEINQTLHSVKLSSGKTLHLSSQAREYTHFPKVGSKIVMENVHFIEQHIFACENSCLSYENSKIAIDFNNAWSKEIVEKHGLSPSDVFQVLFFHRKLKDAFASLSMEQGVELLGQFLAVLVKGSLKSSCAQSCFAKKLNLLTLKECFEEKEWKPLHEANVWCYAVAGVPSAPKEEPEVLFGTLTVGTEGFGWNFADEHRTVCALITNLSNEEIKRKLNSYVLVRKFYFFQEYFSDKKFKSCVYIIMDGRSLEEVCKLPQKTINLESSYKFNLLFLIKNKSTLFIGHSKKPEGALEVEVFGKTCLEKTFILIVSNNLLDMLNCTPGQIVRIFYNEELETTKYSEILRVSNLKQFALTDQKAKVEYKALRTLQDKIYDVKSCKSNLNLPSLISVEGWIKDKKFNKALSSRTVKFHDYPGFGCPEGHTAVLHLFDEETNSHVDMYLNNWDNILYPLGLFPGTQVIVRNVQVQNNKYLKATVFTYLELLDYKPKVYFNSGNFPTPATNVLLKKGFFLSQGEDIPIGAMVKGKIYKICIQLLKLEVVCSTCGEVLLKQTCSKNCKVQEPTFSMALSMFAHDDLGSCKVFSKELEVLRSLLDVDSTRFQNFLEDFKEVKTFEFNFKNETVFGTPFKKLFNKYFHTYNALGRSRYECLGRRMKAKAYEDKREVLWYGVALKKYH